MSYTSLEEINTKHAVLAEGREFKSIEDLVVGIERLNEANKDQQFWLTISDMCGPGRILGPFHITVMDSMDEHLGAKVLVFKQEGKEVRGISAGEVQDFIAKALFSSYGRAQLFLDNVRCAFEKDEKWQDYSRVQGYTLFTMARVGR